MSDLAIAGSPPGPLPECSLFEYVFSNPFSAGSDTLEHASSPKARNHSIPGVPAEKPIFVSTATGGSTTQSRLREDALRVAAGLATVISQNASPTNYIQDPIVLLHLPNCLPYAPLLLGIFAAGLTATMANPALTALELKWILHSARPAIVVTTREGWTNMKAAISTLDDLDLRRILSSKGHVFIVDPQYDDHAQPQDATPVPDGTRYWTALRSSSPLKEAVNTSGGGSRTKTAVILWSSGTSGKSKGVRLSHQAIVASLIGLWHVNQQYDADERWLGFIPFYHVFGLCNILLLAPCCGATVYTMSRFDPWQMLDLVQKHRITYLHVAPPVGLLLGKSPMVDGVDTSSVRGIVSGGASLGRGTIEAVYRRLGLLIHMGYGMSEACSICTQVADTWNELEPQLGSTGQPMYGVEIKVIATDGSNKTLKRGEEGEIIIRSLSVMLGYLNNEAATTESLDSDGWLRSGDIGKIDKLGAVRITDRLKEVIKVKGLQVSPSDLEAILISSPNIADAAVISIFDEEAETELPRAYVVPAREDDHARCEAASKADTNLTSLAQHVKSWTEERTANYKWLRGNVVFVQQIPKSPAGKILRRLLRDTKGVQVEIYPKKTRPTISKL